MKRIFLFIVTILLGTSTSVWAQTSIKHDRYIVGDASSFWTKTTIPVCWENPDEYLASELNITRNAVSSTWASHSRLRFVGWGKCGAASKGIRILVDPNAHPHVKTFGRYLDGVKNGVVLNFDFKGEYKCFRALDECNRIIAVHEFGHAIGFHHEQNSSQTDPNTRCFAEHYQGQVPNERIITTWDIDSVMNYCNPRWSGNGELSERDMRGVAIVYGDPSSKTVNWTGQWRSETYNALVDRRFGYIVNLRQKDDRVLGTYRSNTEVGNFGVIEGIVNGNALQGTWTRTDPHAPSDAHGEIILTLDTENNIFGGHYSQGSWSGYKE